jgi:hypothetical protein
MGRPEPQAVGEIHEIRERLYEEQKNWTGAERIAYYNRVGEELAKQLGLRVAHGSPRRKPPKA